MELNNERNNFKTVGTLNLFFNQCRTSFQAVEKVGGNNRPMDPMISL